MKKIDFRENILPHLLALACFIIILVAYFSPAFLGNEEVKQHDILQAHGSAKEIADYRQKTGEEALWTNSMFSGMPAYLISIEFYGEVIRNFSNKIQYTFPHPSGLVLIQFVCFYILLLSYGVRPLYAAIGAIGFGMASFTFISIYAGHNNKVKAIGYAPLLLAGINYVFRKKFALGFVVTAIGIALQIGSNHYQITYYLLLIILIYGITQFVFSIKEKTLPQFAKKIGILVLAGVLGLASNAGSFLTTLEYAKYSQRGKSELTQVGGKNIEDTGGLDKEYAFNYSLGIMETFSLLIPNIHGGASTGTLTERSEIYKLLRSNYSQVNANQFIQNVPLYWGEQPMTAGPTYFGAILVFLFVLGMLILDNKVRYWLLGATILSILLAWGKNFESFNYLIFDFLPGYNKFRAVTMTLVIAQICVALGALLALQRVFETGFTKELQKKVFIAFACTGGLSFFFVLFAGSFNTAAAVDAQVFGQASDLIAALKEDRVSLLRGDALRSFFLILLATGLVLAALWNKIGKQVAVIIIGVLVVADLYLIDKRYLNNENFERKAVENHFAPTPADQVILQDKDAHYRVLNFNNPFNEARTSFFHHSIGGYHAVKMKRYMDLIEHQLSGEMNQAIEGLRNGSPDFSGLTALNMLNAKYFMFSTEQNGVIKNDYALGNAWFVKGVEKVKSPDDEIAALQKINPREIAVVDVSKFNVSKESYPTDSAANIRLTDYSPKYLRYEANNSSNGLVVFSEIYYPHGWKAFIDGKPAELIRANYVLRSMEVPAGRHVIELKFEPQSYILGNTLSLVSSILLLLFIVAALVFYYRRGTKAAIGL